MHVLWLTKWEQEQLINSYYLGVGQVVNLAIVGMCGPVFHDCDFDFNSLIKSKLIIFALKCSLLTQSSQLKSNCSELSERLKMISIRLSPTPTSQACSCNTKACCLLQFVKLQISLINKDFSVKFSDDELYRKTFRRDLATNVQKCNSIGVHSDDKREGHVASGWHPHDNSHLESPFATPVARAPIPLRQYRCVSSRHAPSASPMSFTGSYL